MINLVDLLWSKDSKHEEQPRVNPNYVNVSSLATLCPRKYYLANAQENKLLSTGFISSNLKITFHLGYAIEEYFRRNFIEQYGITKVLGMWKVKEGIKVLDNDNISIIDGEEYEFRFAHKDHTLEDFKELEVKDSKYRVKGHIDWVFLDTNGKLTIVDVKSISKLRFDALKNSGKPDFGYVVQVCSYYRLLAQDPRVLAMKMKVNSDTKIFYICKEYRQRDDIDKTQGNNAVYKEVIINYKDFKEEILELWKDAKYTISSVKKKTAPDRVTCKSISCPSAKKCPYVARCFNG